MHRAIDIAQNLSMVSVPQISFLGGRAAWYSVAELSFFLFPDQLMFPHPRECGRGKGRGLGLKTALFVFLGREKEPLADMKPLRLNRGQRRDTVEVICTQRSLWGVLDPCATSAPGGWRWQSPLRPPWRCREAGNCSWRRSTFCERHLTPYVSRTPPPRAAQPPPRTHHAPTTTP